MEILTYFSDKLPLSVPCDHEFYGRVLILMLQEESEVCDQLQLCSLFRVQLPLNRIQVGNLIGSVCGKRKPHSAWLLGFSFSSQRPQFDEEFDFNYAYVQLV